MKYLIFLLSMFVFLQLFAQNKEYTVYKYKPGGGKLQVETIWAKRVRIKHDHIANLESLRFKQMDNKILNIDSVWGYSIGDQLYKLDDSYEKLRKTYGDINCISLYNKSGYWISAIVPFSFSSKNDYYFTLGTNPTRYFLNKENLIKYLFNGDEEKYKSLKETYKNVTAPTLVKKIIDERC